MEPETIQPTEPSSSQRIIPAIIVGIVVLVGIFFVYQATCAKLNTLPKQSPLRESLFLVESRGKLTLSKIGSCGIKKINYRGLIPIEVARAGDVTVGLFINRLGKTDVYEIKERGQPELLTDDGENKTNLALSPDGKLFAFTRGAGENQEIKIVTLSKLNEVVTVGFGSNVQFLDNETIFYLSPHGFALKNTRTGNGSELRDSSALDYRKFFVVGLNDTFAVQNPLISQVDIFKITSRIPLFFEPSQNIYGKFEAVSISSGIFYGVHRDVNGNYILVTNLGDTLQTIFTFPQNSTPKDLIE